MTLIDLQNIKMQAEKSLALGDGTLRLDALDVSELVRYIEDLENDISQAAGVIEQLEDKLNYKGTVL